MRIVLVLLFVAAANAVQLLKVSEPIPGRYIVKIKPGIKVQSVLQSVSLLGDHVRYVYENVLNGFAADLSDKALDVVLNLPSVEYVEEDGVTRAMGSTSLWGLDRIDQRSGTDGQYNPLGTGSGVRVYVFDTGIRATHNDFGGRVTTGMDCTTSMNKCEKGGTDGNGHGTHCAGTVGGATYGVAKKVELTSIKVLTDSGGGSWSYFLAGVDHVAGEAAGNLAVASMSMGGGFSQSVNDAVADLTNKGVPTVVAAGNENQDACNVSPASQSSALTVGATNINDDLWYDFRTQGSNYGTCLDIFAPGEDIQSAWYWGDNASVTISGTSMATPHVAERHLVLHRRTFYNETPPTAADQPITSNGGSGSLDCSHTFCTVQSREIRVL